MSEVERCVSLSRRRIRLPISWIGMNTMVTTTSRAMKVIWLLIIRWIMQASSMKMSLEAPTAMWVKKLPKIWRSLVRREMSLPEWFLLWNFSERDMTRAKRAFRMSMTIRCPTERMSMAWK